MRTLIGLAFVLGVAGVAVPGTASAAAADYPTAYLTKTQYLARNPDPGLPDSCAERDITLAAGRYNWGFRAGSSSPVAREIRLGAGTYRWSTCLNPDGDGYLHTSVLLPRNPDWDPASIGWSWNPSSSGTYTWGSFLDPLF
ncbi:hypothetical protein [Goodfellowiella coeruleoviolacea]|uniref:hypothetical protein n=1 Tax=Goodfellowiella coeruleoviolacea TaxID=334858 RepID=UPI0020A546FE|nr:hypothetical protein [Goodfellowiella coeruleoviolacea]